ncbi:FHA domain protein (macronuclear) [Tetrahymena thermophila SB210]|uniref:FHA domain protein n=1 Tax=Tetrahymena thermophila (strain SB210) TaxID=312017 RepID=W7XK49_TETTS|nr:FHA domain protein [Tetrahymena thermophila SB210]EWS74599.1 FHA domain protein [Tetrahymena thermophila SB210]|eukprot:XP_012652821.1 FHA domain protein [Tetrahymena thermophila SB210]
MNVTEDQKITVSIIQSQVRITNSDQYTKQITFEKAFLLGNMSEQDMAQRKQENPNLTLIQIQDQQLSRYHLKVEQKDNKLYINDLGSINGTYLCNPDNPEDYELEIEKEFIVEDTTMLVTKRNNNSSDFCLYVLDGYLSGNEFNCKCNNQNSFFFQRGDIRQQMINYNEVNYSLVVCTDVKQKDKYKNQSLDTLEIKWDEKTKKLIVQKNEKLKYWIRISKYPFPGQKIKQYDKAVLRLGNRCLVQINPSND